MFDRKLRYLNALATEANFSRAAAVCKVAQPTLSKAIRQLETELGVQIVRRDPQFGGLTQEGEIVLAWARRIIADTDSLREDLREAGKSFSGVLRLGILPVTFPLMTVFTSRFSKLHPRVNLKVTDYDAPEIVRAFKKGDIDLAVTYVGDYPGPAGRSHVLFEEEYELVIGKASKFAPRKNLVWSDIDRMPLCSLPPSTRVFSPDVVRLLDDLLKRTRHIITTSILMVMEHVRTGEWATVLPKTIRISLAEEHKIVAIPLPKTDLTPSIGIVIPADASRRGLAESFFSMATSKDTLQVLNAMMNRPNLKDAYDVRNLLLDDKSIPS